VSGTPETGNSFEKNFVEGVYVACTTLGNAANNQQLVDRSGRVIDTSNCNAFGKTVEVNLAGITSAKQAYAVGYNRALNSMFQYEPLCDPQNNCITRSDFLSMLQGAG